MTKKSEWLVCVRCGKTDKTSTVTIPHHIGTKNSMHCPDCGNVDGKALLCRDCCPTGHQTRIG